MRRRCLSSVLTCPVIAVGLVLAASNVRGDDAHSSDEGLAYQQAVDRAVSYLKTKAQGADGGYAAYAGPGVTAVVTTGLLHNGRSPDEPVVAKSLKYLAGFAQPDGGIYQKDSLYRNYETSLAVLCFTAANRDGRYDKLLKNAEKFLKGEQWDEGEGKSIDDPAYGGAGYGKHQRPDLSNTQFLVDALQSLGNGPEDESIKKALIFVSRCQNLESEHNTTGHAAKNPDGGFYYTAAAGGSSQAGTLPNGGLRSYGSMTYAGLKSMIYAGVGPDDPRVKAAFAWIQKNYDVKANPYMGNAGLYYYYHTFAKALDAMKVDTIQSSDGTVHNWRRELREELLRRQKPDGSWVNENSRWLEGEPALVTGYALLTLAYCGPGAEPGK